MHAKRSAVTGRRTVAGPVTGRRRRRADPARALLGGDSGSLAASMLGLQQLAGNRAVAQMVRTYEGNGNAGSISLHGEARPHYDGGSSTILDPRVKPAKGCDCPAEDPCLTGTGTLKVTYKVDVDIVMPDMPDGLDDCQQRRVRAFLRDELGPHEREHARRLHSYDGTTRRPFTVKACGRQALDEAVRDKVQQMHTDEHDQRSAAADKLSEDIDPFKRKIDLRC